MNENIIKKRLKNLFKVIIGLLFLSGLTTACEGGDLSRAKAKELIIASPQLSQSATLSLITQDETQPFGINKLNADEKKEEAEKRNLRMFLEYNPQIAVTVHLGLAEVQQTFLREEKGLGLQIPAKWFFSVKVRATEAGKAMWKDYDLPASDEALPLGKKEFLKVVEITSLAENQRAVEFVWKWIPNKLGMALQEATEEFKSLPVDLQSELLGQTESNRQPKTEDWSGERTVKALFQRTDNGWKLEKFW